MQSLHGYGGYTVMCAGYPEHFMYLWIFSALAVRKGSPRNCWLTLGASEGFCLDASQVQTDAEMHGLFTHRADLVYGVTTALTCCFPPHHLPEHINAPVWPLKKGVPENFMFQLGIGPKFNHWKKEFKKTSCFLLGLTDTWLGRCTHVRWTEQQPGLHIPASMHCLWRQFEITLFSKLALYTAEFQLTSCGITYYIRIKTKWAHHD